MVARINRTVMQNEDDTLPDIVTPVQRDDWAMLDGDLDIEDENLHRALQESMDSLETGSVYLHTLFAFS